MKLTSEELRLLRRAEKNFRLIGQKLPPAKLGPLGPTSPGWFSPTTGPAWLGSYTHQREFRIDHLPSIREKAEPSLPKSRGMKELARLVTGPIGPNGAGE